MTVLHTKMEAAAVMVLSLIKSLKTGCVLVLNCNKEFKGGLSFLDGGSTYKNKS